MKYLPKKKGFGCPVIFKEQCRCDRSGLTETFKVRALTATERGKREQSGYSCISNKSYETFLFCIKYFTLICFNPHKTQTGMFLKQTHMLTEQI